ncbi:MAG: alpha/beta fold hydrolase, partial [Actinomycetota bacterium]|nr:alpha/beta fold hydrolase [Actinomycetota bacterium]
MLAHELHGNGPPLVFLHGLTFTRRTWLPVVERLEGYLRVVVDLPGHGASAGSPTTQDGLVCRLRELIHHLELERPVLVGHSFGAVPATLYAARHDAGAIVNVDQSLGVRDLADGLGRLARKFDEDFGATFAEFRAALGIERIPEPHRTLVEH